MIWALLIIGTQRREGDDGTVGDGIGLRTEQHGEFGEVGQMALIEIHGELLGEFRLACPLMGKRQELDHDRAGSAGRQAFP